MNDCDRFLQIQAAADEAPADDRVWAAAHAASCPGCRALAVAFRLLEETLSHPEEPPTDFATKTTALLDAEVQLRRWRPRPGRALLTAAAGLTGAALAAAALWFLPGDVTALVYGGSLLITAAADTASSPTAVGHAAGAAAALTVAAFATVYLHLVRDR